MKKYIHTITLQIAIFALPLVTGAQLTPPAPITSVQGIYDKIFCRSLNWIYLLAIIAGVIYLILSAFKFMSSGGNPEKVAEARKAAIFGIVGLVVAILAKSAPYIVANFLDSTLADFCT